MAAAGGITEGRAGGSEGVGSPGALSAAMRAPGARGLLALAVPLVLSRAGLAIMAIVTAALVARSDASQVAALALAEGTVGRLVDVGIAFVASAIVLFVPSGDTTACRDRRLALWLRTTACAVAFGGVALLAALAAPMWLHLLGQPAHVANEMLNVLLLLGCSAPAGLAAIASAIYLEATGRAQAVTVAVVLANIFNAAIGAALITGWLGLPALGATGAALTSLIIRVLLAAVLVGLVVRTRDFDAQSQRRLDASTSRKHWRLGLSAAGATGALHAMGVTMTGLAGWIGTLDVAAYASCWIIILPALLVAGGTAEAIAVRVAASRTRTHLDAVLRGDFGTLALIMVPMALALAAAAPAIGSAYSRDAALAALIGQLLPLAALVLLLDAFAIAGITALRGLGDTRVALLVQLGVVLLTPALAYVFAFTSQPLFPTGVLGLLSAIVITSSVRLALVALRLHHVRRASRLSEA